jgi:ADP-ribose pyrophosphatase YjhB (NUDIX family)
MEAQRLRLRLLYKLLRLAAWISRGPFTAGSCALVLRGTGEILLVQNRGRGGAWGLPGGFWKRKEAPIDALRRELAEEIGLEGEYAIVPIDQYKQDIAPHLDFLYTVEVGLDFEPQRKDRKEVRRINWFSLQDLPPLLPEASLALKIAERRGALRSQVT